MARPTVLVVDSQEQRRKELVRGLAEFAYEVIAAADADEGKRFAAGLNPSVIVVEAALKEFVGAPAESAAAGESEARPSLTVVLSESDAGAEEAAEGPVVVPVAGLNASAILRKLRTIVVGQEIGLEADSRLEALVGNLNELPFFELLPRLQRAVVTGRVLVGEGELTLRDGELIGAQKDKVRAVKAFCRIARTASGAFRVLLGPPGGEREISQDLLSVMALAMEDQHRYDEVRAGLPDLASRLRLVMGGAFFATQFTPAQQTVLAGAHDNRSVWSVLDTVAAADGAVLKELAQLAQLGFIEFEEPEAKVRIVTDSTCDLPPELALRNQIHVVSLSVIFGETIYKDGVDLSPGAFYKLLQSKKEAHPRTSPPTKGEFLVQYRPLVGRRDVVSVHISEKMSQTIVNARTAVSEGADEFQRLRPDGQPLLEVIDSTQVSVGLGLLALFGARLARRGRSAQEIRVCLEGMRDRLHLLFVVDTLEYLARGGRIGKARAMVGGLLGIKPILGLVDGEVAPVDRVRGGKAAHPRLVELFKQRVDASKPVVIGVGHATAPVWADRLRTLLMENFQVAEIIEAEIGPVVGTHVGPGCVGAAMFQPTEEELPLIAPVAEAG